ncbi:MAG TPA: hypothetical protein IAA62_00290 [Candidatus Caccopulliclostridium gallistercoris]|uniref:Uncharacterized protein n=1 Tax=Candidatus Caccopulliclostridium gallistercoris TaxID=2840719 RepID=A0A9D1NEB4_9FIRM|nr:hypothetical protein [Candidatus Caccopulliclostridium gallistercoris]
MGKFKDIFKGLTGLIGDLFRDTEVSKGFEEAGGIDGMTIHARGGNASDVKAFKTAKERYQALKAQEYVDGKGEIIRDPNGNPIPERNADGSVRRDMNGRVVYQRGPRKPSPYDFPIR